MVNTTAGVVVMVAMLTAGVAERIEPASGSEVVVVLHVANGAHVSPAILAEAEEQAALVYQAAGVRVVWTGGADQKAQPDGGFHGDVVIRSKDLDAGQRPSEGNAEAVLGSASRPTKRAYIFYDRILNHARLTGCSVARLLGAVMTHEVGRLLSPAFSHSPSGITRARWDERIVRVPDFTVEQGMTIRALLATATVK